MEYIYLSASWIIYYAFHSILATDSIKKKVSDLLPNENIWRICYSIISTLGLLVLLFQMAVIAESTLWKQHALFKLASMISMTYGLIIIKLSFKNQSVLSFLTTEDRFDDNSELKTNGVYSKVRHPLYSGTILIFVGLFIFIPKISTIIALAITIAYLIVGIPIEERKLIAKFGDRYLEYKKKVPAVFPRLF
ncbi:MAG: isoprenylcysteine carboxylmethyltransferase family protein [Bacteroidota bacterium]